MLEALASPSVCVIDDEKADYEPILAVLNGCFISAIHLSGSPDSLPVEPFSKLQLVFLDLHLSGTIGKDAASYTANFFRRTVSSSTAPLVVVIWSKYAGDVPAGEEETEAQLFKRTLLEAVPDYVGRLIFVEMPKPKTDARPADWRDTLKAEIEAALQGQSAIEVLWAWRNLVQQGCAKVSQDLTLTAQTSIAGTARTLTDGLMATMQKLAKAQSDDGQLGVSTAPSYLLSVLSQLLLDQLENPIGAAGIAAHGDWLSAAPGQVPADFPAKMNGMLLTSEPNAEVVYAPGTVFRITDSAGFQAAFGKGIDDFLSVWVAASKQDWQAWLRIAEPVLIELSPVCDLAQGHRVNSLLVAGVIVPSTHLGNWRKSGDAFGNLAVNFHLRWPIENFVEQEVSLSVCNRYKVTLPATQAVNWLMPWFRLRELPTASIRNASAAHASRVGYASM